MDGKGHPSYVLGETDKKYKSFGLTIEANDRERKIRLKHNPNPGDQRVSYIRVKPITTSKKYFSDAKTDWSFGKEDQPIIRHLKKDYKKRAYRSKKKKK